MIGVGCPCCDISIVIYVVLGCYLATKCIGVLPVHKHVRTGLNAVSFTAGISILLMAVFMAVLKSDPEFRSMVFAKLCSAMTKSPHMNEKRCGLLQNSGVRGVVVEIGTGPATNFRCWGNDTIDSKRTGGFIQTYIGVEPNRHFESVIKAEKVRVNLPFQVNMMYGSGASVPDIADGSVDAVVGTHLLCSVSDPSAILQEIARMLKPGGKYFFIEHVSARDEGSLLYASQQFVQPIFEVIGNGCKFSPTWKVFEAHGHLFDVVHEDWSAPMPIPMIRPHIVGTATRKGKVRIGSTPSHQ
jgi:SAM-dependent methyltransferase